MEREDIPALFAVIQGAYQGKFTANQAAADVWTEMLADLDPADVMGAAKLVIAESDWPPTISQIRKMVEEIVAPLPAPELVEARVIQSLQEYGEEQDPTLDEFHQRVVDVCDRRRLYQTATESTSSAGFAIRNAAESLAKKERAEYRYKRLLGRDVPPEKARPMLGLGGDCCEF